VENSAGGVWPYVSMDRYLENTENTGKRCEFCNKLLVKDLVDWMQKCVFEQEDKEPDEHARTFCEKTCPVS
jgi:hypothetical protein